MFTTPLAAKLIGQFLLTVFLADFSSGLIHWFEDAYGHPDAAITGRWITRPNVLHHHDPRYFIRNNWWQSSWDLLCLMLLVVAGAWLMHRLTWEVWLFAFLGTNANEFHKWAHRTPRENGRLITVLQRLHLVQSVRHHARHHTNPKESHYCVLTDFLNPLLDGIHFWETVEFVLLHMIGLRRRIDTSVKPPSGALNPVRQ